jgi:hypothetical protein
MNHGCDDSVTRQPYRKENQGVSPWQKLVSASCHVHWYTKICRIITHKLIMYRTEPIYHYKSTVYSSLSHNVLFGNCQCWSKMRFFKCKCWTIT